jgi:hypothetical protein
MQRVSRTASIVQRFLLYRVLRRHRELRSFESAIRDAGGVGAAVDRGLREVPTERVVGSVGRAQNLRSDFFYRTGKAVTQRFTRIGAAMLAGKALPPLELYKLKPPPNIPGGEPQVSEYYVVDGHHRVAMARQLGQDFLDAHVVEYAGANLAAGLGAAGKEHEAQLAHALRRVALFRDAPAGGHPDLQAGRAGRSLLHRSSRERRSSAWSWPGGAGPVSAGTR